MKPFTYRATDGTDYTVEEGRICGWFSDGACFIWVNANQGPLNVLRTYVHEWLHVEFRRWSESKVADYESKIAVKLWCMGVRKGKGNLLQAIYRTIDDVLMYWPRKYRPDPHALLGYLRNAGYGE